MNLTKNIKSIVLSFIFAATFSVMPTDVWAHSWKHKHGHGHGHEHHTYQYKYTYVYYPAAQVYYSPVDRGYYFLDGGGWTFGMTLPSRIKLGEHVSVQLGGPVPYVYHPVVIQQYPVVVFR